MFHNSNLQALDNLAGHQLDYIVGASIKHISEEMKAKITDISNYTDLNAEVKVANFTLNKVRKLIITHSRTRKKKDNAKRFIEILKLRKKLEASGSIKDHLSNQWFKKYLRFKESTNDTKASSKCDLTIAINEAKTEDDAI